MGTTDDHVASVGPDHFRVSTLGPAHVANPTSLRDAEGNEIYRYVNDAERIRYDVEMPREREGQPVLAFEKAGIREHLYFDPAEVRAAIVTCGGLSPGLNDVIRCLVNELHYRYGVNRAYGVRYGYQGLNPAFGSSLVPLTPEGVTEIHMDAGTILGSSRGPQPVDVMVDTLVRHGINMLFCIGGDGTQRGAHDIHEACVQRGLSVAVVGIPKTIDNDIAFVYKTFGFETAVEIAKRAIDGAHTEAVAYRRGVGLVKLMGRDSGFIAAYAALSSGHPNYVLVPEVPFALDGPRGLLAHLAERLDRRGHALIVVAEGAGQNLFKAEHEALPGQRHNVRYHDIGLFLRDRIEEHFRNAGEPVSLKYIDPSYMVRNTRANASDSLFCTNLGRAAVHAAMAGKTDVMVGLWYNVLVHVPIPLAVSHRKKISPHSALWFSVLESTGQPTRFE